jgi:hypothetical protein
LLALACIVVPAAAQYPGGGGASRGGSGGGQGTRPPAGDPTMVRTPSMVDQLQIQLAELDEDLKLAANQRAAWNTYVERVQRLGNDITRNRNALRFPGGNAAQQFDFLTDTLGNRLTAFEEVADAGKALYALLAPEQKDLADRRLARIAITLIDGVASVPAAPAGDNAPAFIGGRSRREAK